jgi:hypothetical protein
LRAVCLRVTRLALRRRLVVAMARSPFNMPDEWKTAESLAPFPARGDSLSP